MTGRVHISQDYKKPVLRNIAAQVVVLLVGGMMLDGGFFLAVTLVAVAVYWLSLVFVIVRHTSAPTRGDIVWASAGFAIAMALTFVFGPLVLFLRG